MRVFEIRKPYRRLLTLQELGRNEAGEIGLYKVMGYSNKYIALQDEFGRGVHGAIELIITETRKVPLYKQAMDMQMGKKPKTTTQTRSTLRIQEIEPQNVKYEVYIVRI